MPSESFPVDRIERTLRQQLGIVLSPLRAIGLLRTLLLPLTLVASILLALPALSAAENTISGTVSLPDGRTATEDMYVTMCAQTEDYSASVFATAYIAAGASEGTYTLTVPPDTSASWRVYYFYLGDESYQHSGYYNDTVGTLTMPEQATLLPGGADHSGINLTLLINYTISGTVSLPEGHQAPDGGVVVAVLLVDEDGNGGGNEYIIPAGESSVDYSLSMPSDTTVAWRVGYLLWETAGAYLERGYYSAVATQWQLAQADPLSGGQDYPNINLTLLTGTTISGTVSLPIGHTSPEGGMWVSIVANNQNGSEYASNTVFIEAEQASVIYTLAVLPIADASWQIRYSYFGDGPYLQSGYYSATGTQWQSSKATLLSGESAYSTIDLTLLTGNTVSGTISLPAGQKAPAGGLEVPVYLVDNADGFSGSGKSFVIPAGEASVTYSLPIPPDTSVSKYVMYDFWSSTEAYLSKGYYSTTGTQWQFVQATPLPGGADHAGINLTLLTGNTISGVVSLPDGRKAPAGGISVQVQVWDMNNSWSHSAFVVIPENSTSAPYAMAVQPDSSASWIVGYFYSGVDGNFLDHGTYSASGTKWHHSMATLLPGGVDRSGVNLTLLVGKIIDGTVSLPTGKEAPNGGMTLSLYLDTEIAPWFSSTQVSIPEGGQSAAYSIIVPDDPETFWTVRYSGLSDDEAGSLYLPEGYYNTSGTQWRQEAATLLPGADHSSVNLTLLTGSTISGTVSLPTGISAPDGGIYIDVYVYDTYRDNYYSDRTVFVPAGQNSANYTLAVPNDASASWQIFYFYYAEEGTNLEHCLREGYYSSTGTQWRDDLATPVQGGVDWSSINLTLLLGKTISGIASPPPGLPFDDGVDIDVCAVNDLVRYQWIYCDYIGVASDSAGEAYKVTVPQDAAVSWTVRYELDLQSTLDNPNNFLRTGYYSTSGTQWRSTLATPVQGGVDRSGIDLPLLVGGKTISGTVSLPGPDLRGVLVAFSVSDPNDLNNPVSTGYVNLGGNFAPSATYSLPVPADADVSWTVWYEDYGIDWYYSESKYVNPGYYNATGTRWRADAATPVAGGDDRTGLNMVLLQPTTISGTVSLPAGQTAPAGGTTVSVQVSEQTNMDALAGSRYITIPGGRVSASYSVFVPIDPSALWAVRYSYDGPGDYLIQGYFSIAGTRVDLVNATLLDGGAPLTGVNLTLLRSQDLDPDTDGDNLPDAWEIVYFGNLTTANGTTDYDRDGYTDLQEYLNDEQGETDPLGAAYDPKQGNAPGGTGYVSISNDEGFWEIMTPVIINSAREAAAR